MSLPQRKIDNELASWVKTYTAEMLSWAYRRTSDLGVSEDLVQDTFLVATEKISSFRRDSHPRTWLFGILNNKIAEHYRQKSRMQTTELQAEENVESAFSKKGHWNGESAPLPWETADEHLFNDPQFVLVFERCLAALPQSWHGCLTAKFIENRSPEEICQDVGISTTNYWQIVHRAKLKMRSCLEHHWFARKQERP